VTFVLFGRVRPISEVLLGWKPQYIEARSG